MANWFDHFLTWIDRNFKRLLIVGLFANAAAFIGQLLYYAACQETIEDVAREEVHKWLATHNITVVVQHQEPSTITMPTDVFMFMLTILGFGILSAVIIATATR